MKQKTHKGVVKRIKVIGFGKLCREQANRCRPLESKSFIHTRHLKGATGVAKSDVKRVKCLPGRV